MHKRAVELLFLSVMSLANMLPASASGVEPQNTAPPATVLTNQYLKGTPPRALAETLLGQIADQIVEAVPDFNGMTMYAKPHNFQSVCEVQTIHMEFRHVTNDLASPLKIQGVDAGPRYFAEASPQAVCAGPVEGRTTFTARDPGTALYGAVLLRAAQAAARAKEPLPFALDYGCPDSVPECDPATVRQRLIDVSIQNVTEVRLGWAAIRPVASAAILEIIVPRRGHWRVEIDYNGVCADMKYLPKYCEIEKVQLSWLPYPPLIP